jgi:predicted MPP superfamily phosphohydrolase
MKFRLPNLTFGNSPGAVQIRDESYPFGARFEILYLSDFHFHAGSAALAAALLTQVQQAAPGLILLGGDYADTRAGLVSLAQFVRGAARVAPVLAVAGNHDFFLGIELVRRALLAAGAQWLEGRHARFRLDEAHELLLAGNYAAGHAGPPRPGLLRILCAHYPPATRALPATHELLLAGHLHGGQVVGWQLRNELYPGRFFYPWNGLRYHQGGTTLLVSRGIGDTLPVRYRCPREIIRIRLTPAV